MQAIETKYVGPTNHRGSRIIAKAACGSITIAYDGALSTLGAHKKAAEALARKFNWPGEYVGGGSADQNGYVFVNVSNHDDSFTVERDED